MRPHNVWNLAEFFGGLVRKEGVYRSASRNIRDSPSCFRGPIPKQAAKFSREVSEVMKPEVAGGKLDDRIPLQPASHGVQATALIVPHRSECVPFQERQYEGSVAHAEFPAEVDCSDWGGEPCTHELIGKTENS